MFHKAQAAKKNKCAEIRMLKSSDFCAFLISDVRILAFHCNLPKLILNVLVNFVPDGQHESRSCFESAHASDTPSLSSPKRKRKRIRVIELKFRKWNFRDAIRGSIQIAAIFAAAGALLRVCQDLPEQDPGSRTTAYVEWWKLLSRWQLLWNKEKNWTGKY